MSGLASAAKSGVTNLHRVRVRWGGRDISPLLASQRNNSGPEAVWGGTGASSLVLHLGVSVRTLVRML